MSTQEIDDRAAAALSVDGGLDWEEALRLVAILRAAHVLRTPNGIRRADIAMRAGADAHVDIEFESGQRISGDLRNDLRPMLTYSNPLLP
ncbi:hypothetical protein [Nocardia sp. Marseille-Q1738]